MYLSIFYLRSQQRAGISSSVCPQARRPPASAFSELEYIAGSRFFAAKSMIRFRSKANIGSAVTSSLRAPSFFIAVKARSKSSTPFTSTESTVIPNAGWQSGYPLIGPDSVGLVGFHTIATRRNFGTTSLSNSSRFVLTSTVPSENPVMFPPGAPSQPQARSPRDRRPA